VFAIHIFVEQRFHRQQKLQVDDGKTGENHQQQNHYHEHRSVYHKIYNGNSSASKSFPTHTHTYIPALIRFVPNGNSPLRTLCRDRLPTDWKPRKKETKKASSGLYSIEPSQPKFSCRSYSYGLVRILFCSADSKQEQAN
jgi:hypothetical protein